jgi:putative tricarboxylic transport membrane protein
MRKVRFLFFPLIVVFSLFVLSPAFIPSARAEYPEQDKVIEWLHHSSPGGAAGLFMLTTADILNKTGIVKPKIQVQTRQGGSSAVALNYLYSKGGDPYVVMHWTTSQLMAMIRGATKMKLSDCVWLGTVVEDPSVLIVPYDSPYKTLKELIDDAKAHPKKIRAGVNSIGGSEHIQTIRIEKATGAKFTVTSFEFSPTALIGGHIDMAFGNTAETAEHVKAKRARALAAVAPHRLPYYKDVPTLIEQGVNASFTQYRGFFGGPNFPPEAVKFWEDALAKMVKTKEFEEFTKKSDVIVYYKNAAETKAFLVDYVKALEDDYKFMEANK